MRRQVACRRVATAFVLVLLPRVLSARGFRERLRRSCDTLNQGVRKLKSELLDASLPPKEEGYVAHGFLLCILCVKLFVTQNERGSFSGCHEGALSFRTCCTLDPKSNRQHASKTRLGTLPGSKRGYLGSSRNLSFQGRVGNDVGSGAPTSPFVSRPLHRMRVFLDVRKTAFKLNSHNAECFCHDDATPTE